MDRNIIIDLVNSFEGIFLFYLGFVFFRLSEIERNLVLILLAGNLILGILKIIKLVLTMIL